MLFLFQERQKGLGLKHMERTWGGVKTSLKIGQKEETLDEDADNGSDWYWDGERGIEEVPNSWVLLSV